MKKKGKRSKRKNSLIRSLLEKKDFEKMLKRGRPRKKDPKIIHVNELSFFLFS